MKYKRFLCNEEFNKEVSKEKIEEIIGNGFHEFDENGVSTLCKCCGEGHALISLDIPNPGNKYDKKRILDAKTRMNHYLEMHIRQEIKNLKQEMGLKIKELREKYKKLR